MQGMPGSKGHKVRLQRFKTANGTSVICSRKTRQKKFLNVPTRNQNKDSDLIFWIASVFNSRKTYVFCKQ